MLQGHERNTTPSTSELLVELGSAYLSMGKGEAAAWHAELARRRCVGDDDRLRLEALETRMAVRQGSIEALEAQARRSLARGCEGKARRLAETARCEAALLRGEWTRALRWHRSLGEGSVAGDERGRTLHLAARAELGSGSLDRAEGLATAALAEARRRVSSELLLPSALLCATIARMLGKEQRAEAHLLSIAERLDEDLAMAASWWMEQSLLAMARGEGSRANGLASRALGLARCGQAPVEATVLLHRCELRLGAGRLVEAGRDAARASALTQGSSRSHLALRAALFETLTALLLDRPEEARACAGPLEVAGRRLWPDEGLLALRVLERLARRLGRFDEARRLSEQFAAATATLPASWRASFLRRAQACRLGDGRLREVLLPGGPLALLPDDEARFRPEAFELWLSLPEGRLHLEKGRRRIDLSATPQLARLIEVVAEADGSIAHGPLFEAVWGQRFDLMLNHVNKLQVAISRLRRQVKVALLEPLPERCGYRIPPSWRWCILRDRPEGRG